MPPESPDLTFNLSALADRLVREKRQPKLAGLIRRSKDLHSLRTDLVMALESIDALWPSLQTSTDPNDHRALITESALLNNAIVLYARATKTTSEERMTFDLRSRFTAAQALVHKEITDLRDAAIAHFGSGGSYEGEWKNELVLLQFKGADSRPGVVTIRQTLDKRLVVRVREQIIVALDLLSPVYQDHLDSIAQEINTIVRDEATFYCDVEEHPLNLELFLRSAEAAEKARASWDKGYAMGSSSSR